MRSIVRLKRCLSLLVLTGFALAISGCAPEATKPAGAGGAVPAPSTIVPKVSSGRTEQAGSEEDMGAEPVAPEESEEGAGQ